MFTVRKERNVRAIRFLNQVGKCLGSLVLKYCGTEGPITLSAQPQAECVYTSSRASRRPAGADVFRRNTDKELENNRYSRSHCRLELPTAENGVQ
jgi:hypothetical protein